MSITGLGSTIDAMKANLFGVMEHPIMPQCIAIGIQGNQMITLVKTALSCIGQVGMTMAAKRNTAISVKKISRKVIWNSISLTVTSWPRVQRYLVDAVD